MLVLRDRLLNVPLMSLQTGGAAGKTTKPIIDPRRLNIVAFYCEGPHIDIHPAIIHAADIREFSSIGMIIDSADSIMSPSELVRLQEVLAFRFELEGKLVIEEGGRKVGKVINYTVDPVTFYVVKLHVKPTFLHSFSSAEVLIDRSQIKTMDNERIIVKRPDVREEPAAAERPPMLDNPFKKPRPQAEAAKAKE